MRIGLLQQGRKRAVILILSLWMVMVLTLLAYSLASEIHIEMYLTRAFRDRYRAEHLNRIGVSRAVADLRNDRLMDYSRFEGTADTDPLFDAFGDVWSGETILPRRFEVEGVGYYDLMVVDEESKINLNSTNPVSVELIKNLLVFLHVDADEALEISHAIWDWKDEDQVPMGAGHDIDATESAYYTELAIRRARRNREPLPTERVIPRDDLFDSLEELLDIPGITPALFYGYDPETEDPPFFPTRSMRSFRRELPGLRDLVTVRAEKLNLNTVSYEVLAALCTTAMQDEGGGRSMAERIITYRQGLQAETIDNNNAFRRLEDIEEVPGVSGGFLALLRQVVPELTTESNNFTIFCQAEVGRVSRSASRPDRDGDSSESMLPSARSIVHCRRGVLSYSEETFEQKSPPPGAKLESQMLMGLPAGAAQRWFVPIIYIDRWIID